MEMIPAVDTEHFWATTHYGGEQLRSVQALSLNRSSQKWFPTLAFLERLAHGLRPFLAQLNVDQEVLLVEKVQSDIPVSHPAWSTCFGMTSLPAGENRAIIHIEVHQYDQAGDPTELISYDQGMAILLHEIFHIYYPGEGHHVKFYDATWTLWTEYWAKEHGTEPHDKYWPTLDSRLPPPPPFCHALYDLSDNLIVPKHEPSCTASGPRPSSPRISCDHKVNVRPWSCFNILPSPRAKRLALSLVD